MKEVSSIEGREFRYHGIPIIKIIIVTSILSIRLKPRVVSPC